ncbi:MAG: M15 family metallopeptidase [Cellvibrionales bacterium]|nr:M15 family metallopeptidase [Cellvibrionales bacterium]
MSEFSDIQKRVLGLTTEHLAHYDEAGSQFLLTPQTLSAFKQLKSAAANAGFNLALISAYRGYDRQRIIWEGKLDGTRKVHDDNGVTIDLSHLGDEEKIAAIIRFSAIPGLSRHHLGTDIDIFDANVMSKNQVMLEPFEVETGGPFAPMHEWLDEQIEQGQACGFVRPFKEGSVTIAPERWHLSFQAEADALLAHLTPELLVKLWQAYPIALKDKLIASCDQYYRFFKG